MNNDTLKLLAAFLIGGAVAWFISSRNRNGSRMGLRTSGDNYSNGDIRCELYDNSGRKITIVGSGPEFERMCKNRSVNLYGYTWYPRYYWTWGWPWGWIGKGDHGDGDGGNGGNGANGAGNGGAGNGGAEA